MELLKSGLIARVRLEEAPIRSPFTAITDLINEENRVLGAWSTHDVLHRLKLAWWTEDALALIKQLPVECFTVEVVDFLNKIFAS